jgi:beta-N-acetylhexosaminidase
MIALGTIAGIAALIGLIIGAGSGAPGDPTGAEASLPAQCSGSSPAAIRRIVEGKLVVRWEGRRDQDLLRRARAGEIGGVILFPDISAVVEDVESEIELLQQSATSEGGPPLIVAIDQEGGPVKRFVEEAPTRSPYDLGLSGTPADALLEGRATGNFLRKLGANVNLAPVLDVPASPDSVMSLRAFGTDPATVERLGLAFARGLEREDVVATAKHFPGLGRSLLNTDLSPSEITASRLELQRDLAPFEAAIEEDIGMVMVGIATYTAYGGEPAALSAPVIQGLLRDRLGYRGVVITDDLGAAGVSTAYETTEAAIAAAAAGVDLLLFAGEPDPQVVPGLVRATQRGRIDLGLLRDSCARLLALRETLSSPGA